MSHTLSTPSGAPPHGGRRHERRWLALVLLCVAQFMLILDLTVVNVALPSIGADLGAGREALTLVVTGYVLAFGGLMLLGGRLADTVGRRRTGRTTHSGIRPASALLRRHAHRVDERAFE